MKRNKAQEEMVGFGLILILVAVIFVVFLSVYLKRPSEPIVNYEANSFIQATLQYTTICQEETPRNLTVQKLIRKCQRGERCSIPNRDSCIVLNSTLKSVIKESWEVNSKTPIKGYSFVINITEGNTKKQFLNITDGVVTNNYKGSIQDFSNEGELTSVLFRVYS